MTARENLTYGLRVRKVPALEIARRLERIVEMTGLADLLERTPERLSGGQQQRVALGRALMREPAVLLFDEPLSNLDAKLRAEMRAELGRLHRETGSTALYVTHDPVEALSLADTLVIMRNGRVEQQGRPRDVYGSPANVFVAQFLGHPGVSLLNATVGDGAEVCLSNGSVVGHAPGIQGRVLVGIRPQHVRIGAGHLSGVTVQVEDHGPFRLVTIDADGFRVTTLESESTIAVGAAVKFEIAWQHGVLFHGEGLQRIDGFRGSTCSAASSRA
jgi:ABC-type sugar transport system ATPase subunit